MHVIYFTKQQPRQFYRASIFKIKSTRKREARQTPLMHPAVFSLYIIEEALKFKSKRTCVRITLSFFHFRMAVETGLV